MFTRSLPAQYARYTPGSAIPVLSANGRAVVCFFFVREWKQHLAGFYDLLSSEERLRAARFARPDDTEVFILSHAVLRLMLGKAIDMAPEDLRFGRMPMGKPYLGNTRYPVQFSLTHCEGAGAVALAYGRRIGIDMERGRPLEDMRLLARHAFAAPVAHWVQSLPAPLQQEAFFTLWTKQEAALKAEGSGLSGNCACTLSHEEGNLATTCCHKNTQVWRLESTLPETGYFSCVATEVDKSRSVREQKHARAETY